MTDQTATPINDKELTAHIVATLRGVPEELAKTETYLSEQRYELAKSRAQLEATELDAKINAVVNGKNAEERKLQADQAVMGNSAVKIQREYVAGVEANIAGKEVEQKKLSRQFQAAMALAELQAARFHLMTTVNKKENVK
jgi:hypothetical protein